MPRRTAIVLHGPMGLGKSTIASELCLRLGQTPHIDLDKLYRLNDPRVRSAPECYQELRDEANHIVVELGCAEPGDLGAEGATTGAQEWYDILRAAGRDVRIFRLMAEWPNIENLMKARRSGELLSARLWHCAHANERVLPASLCEPF